MNTAGHKKKITIVIRWSRSERLQTRDNKITSAIGITKVEIR